MFYVCVVINTQNLKNVMPGERGTFHGKYIKARSSETSNHYIQ